MTHEIAHPPLGTVRRIVAGLEALEQPVAVGGSAVLAARGLVEHVRDWDVTGEGDPAAVEAMLDDLGMTWSAPPSAGRPFATRARYVVDAGDHEIDVLIGFAAWDGDRVEPFPVRVASRWLGLPIADPRVWARAYRLIGRPERAAALERSLRPETPLAEKPEPPRTS